MNPKELLIQCANLFVYGGTEEAVHLHKSFGRMVDVSMPFYKGRELLSLVPDNNRSSLKEGMIFYHNQNDLKRLSNGPHIVKVYNSGGYHAMSLIKLSDNECYIFDPAKGLFEFRGEDFPDQIVQFLNKGYRFSHKFNYLQFVRKTGHAEVGASEIKEMYVQILPMQKPKDFRKFQAVDLSRLAERDREACRAYRIGCLGYIWGYFIDSIKASL